MKRVFTISVMLIALLIAVAAVMIGCSDAEAGDGPVEAAAFSVEYFAELGGYIDGDAKQTVARGDNGSSVRAVAFDGYVFDKWSDGEVLALRNEKNVQKDKSVTAIFRSYTYKMQYTAGKNGTLQGETEQIVEHGQNALTVTAVPNEGYEFTMWSDGVTNATRTDENVQVGRKVTAYFRKQTFTLRYSIEAGGALQGEAEQTVEYGETGVTVTVSPIEGYEFVGWSDGKKEPARTDGNVKSDISVEAVFQKKTYTVKYDQHLDPKKGYIQGEAEQRVEYGGSSSVVKAIPNEGYYFSRWMDGVKTQERSDIGVKGALYTQPYFYPIELTVKYESTKGGWVSNPNYPTIDYGNDAKTVRAIPDKGYVFVRWSDGVTTPERTDCNITGDFEVTACFGYSAEYIVNNGVGGKIIGDVYQAVIPGDDFTTVQAVPDTGYAFCGWSDLQVDAVRRDNNAERCLEHIAYFQPITKTFEYDYGIAHGIPMESSVTIDRNNLRIDGYPTPDINGYTFEGWYTDTDYTVKAINSDGRYMLGYYGFALETNTLYARWKPVDDTRHVFKILIVFVNEVKAKLYPAIKNGDGLLHDVHHQMTAIDREYCELLHSLAVKYLGEWLSELTDIEIDMYHTTEPLKEGDLFDYKSLGNDCYSIFALPEVIPLYTSYHSVLHVWGINNYDGALANRNVVGMAGEKYGNVYLEDFYYSAIIRHTRIQDQLIEIKTIKMREEEFIDTFIHEFIHTCEQAYYYKDIMEFHAAYYHNLTNMNLSLHLKRQYLLGEIEYNGEIGGIPKDFWTNKCDKMLSYVRRYA